MMTVTINISKMRHEECRRYAQPGSLLCGSPWLPGGLLHPAWPAWGSCSGSLFRGHSTIHGAIPEIGLCVHDAVAFFSDAPAQDHHCLVDLYLYPNLSDS